MKSLYPISSSTSPLINDSPPLAQKQSSQRSSRRCHLCEKEFRTKSLLRTHISTVHANGKLLPSTPLHPATNLSFLQPFLDSTSQLAQKVITGQTPQTSYGLVPDAYFCAKMADRVVCEICNKQVCNKYFLKTHKGKNSPEEDKNRSVRVSLAKVHGITQSELQEPSHDNSNRENSDTYCARCVKKISPRSISIYFICTRCIKRRTMLPIKPSLNFSRLHPTSIHLPIFHNARKTTMKMTRQMEIRPIDQPLSKT